MKGKDFWDLRAALISRVGGDPDHGTNPVDDLLDAHEAYLGYGVTDLSAEERASHSMTVLGEVVPEGVAVKLGGISDRQFLTVKGSHEALYDWLARMVTAMDWRVAQLPQDRRLELLRGPARELDE